jgi:hypothetical protein
LSAMASMSNSSLPLCWLLSQTCVMIRIDIETDLHGQ